MYIYWNIHWRYRSSSVFFFDVVWIGNGLRSTQPNACIARHVRKWRDRIFRKNLIIEQRSWKKICEEFTPHAARMKCYAKMMKNIYITQIVIEEGRTVIVTKTIAKEFFSVDICCYCQERRQTRMAPKREKKLQSAQIILLSRVCRTFSIEYSNLLLLFGCFSARGRPIFFPLLVRIFIAIWMIKVLRDSDGRYVY